MPCGSLNMGPGLRRPRSVGLPLGDHAPHATLGLGDIAGTAGDEVDMPMHHRLPRAGAVVEAKVESIDGRV